MQFKTKESFQKDQVVNCAKLCGEVSTERTVMATGFGNKMVM